MSRWSLNQKIYSVIAILSLSLISISIFGMTKLTAMSANFNFVTDVKLKKLLLTYELRTTRNQIALAEKNMIISADAAEVMKLKTEMDKHADHYLEVLSQLEKTAAENETAQFSELRIQFEQLLKSENSIADFAKKNDDKSARELSLGKTAAIHKKMGAIATNLVEQSDKEMNTIADESTRTAQSSMSTFIALSLGSLLLSISIAIFVLRSTGRTIKHVLEQLGNNSNQVASASSQIAASSSELSSSTTQQAAALQETTASVEELSSMTQKNTESADHAATMSTASRNTCDKGQTMIQEMLKAMHEINLSNDEITSQTKQSNEHFSEIVKIISDIGSKTKVINDIVFQTKLLSFNASVEAARAGEHGKGFAVVAEEVGKLAQMSGNAAKEISGMLDNSAQRVSSIVSNNQMKLDVLLASAREKVSMGAQTARRCEDALMEIGQSARDVNSMAASIASASKEQSQGIGEITKAMNQLDQATQQNSSVTNDCSNAAEALAQQAHELQAIVNHLSLAVLGSKNNQLGAPQNLGSPGSNKSVTEPLIAARLAA